MRAGYFIVAAVLAGVATFAGVQDRVTAAGARRYVTLQRVAAAGRGRPVTVDEVMAPAIAASVREGAAWGGGVTAAGLIAAGAAARFAAARRR